MRDLDGRWALVTGASAGLGADFARALAARRCNTVLVARREERLKDLAQELEREAGVRTRVLRLDLCEPDAPDRLLEDLEYHGIEIDVLINNAGFGFHGEEITLPWERERLLLELDVVRLVHLTRLFLPGMLERGFGYVLQLSSIAGYVGVPTYAAYCASKAFVLSYGEALSYELRNTGVHMCVFCPGITETEFFDVAGQGLTMYQRMVMMPSSEVAEVGIRALLEGRRCLIAGWRNKLSVLATRLIPRRFHAPLCHFFMMLDQPL